MIVLVKNLNTCEDFDQVASYVGKLNKAFGT